MATTKGEIVLQTDYEMPGLTFAQLQANSVGPRLGRLLNPGRSPLATPHYLATTSRGAVPHVSHDVLRKHTEIRGAYIALEDFIEKAPQNAPIFQTPTQAEESRLRKYIALPNDCLSIMGPRRIPAIPCPAQNTSSSIAVSTSVGFRHLEVDDYIEAVRVLQPDIAVSIADIITAERGSGKRVERSIDRTHAWLRDTLSAQDAELNQASAMFARVPALEKEQQSFYLSDLADEYRPQISGLAIQSPTTVDALPKELSNLPRLCLDEPASPHAILHAISRGVDLITVPFVAACSEHGLAFSFVFPAPTGLSGQALGFDLWSADHATDLSPLAPSCSCYTCTRHHRAYVHHCLMAREMLAWTMLQVHNFAMLDAFFAKVRESISRGTFDQDYESFTRAYSAGMPVITGEGPRIRGYQMKSVGGGEPKKNPKGYNRLDDTVQRLAEADSGIATPTGDSRELEEHGFAEKTG